MFRPLDTKLGRDVAIKVLPEEFARDQERLDRFEREARLLAQLNHANVATLHGLEEHHGRRFLVMELVEGETLAERIALFFLEGTKIMVAELSTEPPFSASPPRELVDPGFARDRLYWFRSFDVSADGQRFLFIEEGGPFSRAEEIVFVLNWFDELQQLAPAEEGS